MYIFGAFMVKSSGLRNLTTTLQNYYIIIMLLLETFEWARGVCRFNFIRDDYHIMQ